MQFLLTVVEFYNSFSAHLLKHTSSSENLNEDKNTVRRDKVGWQIDTC